MVTTLEILKESDGVRLVRVVCHGRDACPAELVEQVYLQGEQIGASGVACVLVVNGEPQVRW